MSGNNHPIVFVHGILGWGPEEMGFGNRAARNHYWGIAHQVRQPNLKFASVGPISSYWDRARELFYQLKGESVDYGSRPHIRARHRHYGKRDPNNPDERFFKEERLHLWPKRRRQHPTSAHYPQWNSEHPLHFVGHSQGCLTILLLQWMLAQKKMFPKVLEGGYHETSPDWIKSVTCISGVLNGTPLPYSEAARASYITGLLPNHPKKAVRQFFGVDPLIPGFLADVIQDANTPRLLLQALFNAELGSYNWDLQQWGLRRRGTIGAVVDAFTWWNPFFPSALTRKPLLFFLDELERHPMLYARDNAPYSLSIHGTAQLNQDIQLYDNTYYFSLPTTSPVSEQSGALIYFSNQIEQTVATPQFAKLLRGFNQDHWPEAAKDPEHWKENDGLVPAVTQTHPWLGTKHAIDHQSCGTWPDQPQTGRFYSMDLLKNRQVDHLQVVVFPEDPDDMLCFYTDMVKQLRQLP